VEKSAEEDLKAWFVLLLAPAALCQVLLLENVGDLKKDFSDLILLTAVHQSSMMHPCSNCCDIL
jgi:hypothetical protein